jgi:hypothetical protein
MQESSFERLKKLLDTSYPLKKDSPSEVKKQADKFESLQEMLSHDRHVYDSLKKQISSIDHFQVLISSKASENKSVLCALVKIVLESKRTPVVVLTSSNYISIRKLFEENKIDSSLVVIMDTVSKNISSVKDEKNLLFVDSLRNLTQIQIKSVKEIENRRDCCFIFESVDVLSLYHDEQVLLKFVYSFTKLLHKYSSPSFFIANKRSFLPKLAQFFDDFFEAE